MGNFCINCCNDLHNTVRGNSKQTQQAGKKKAKFIDFNIGASTISKEEFKQATKRREEQEKKIEQIETMKLQELDKELGDELQDIKLKLLEQRIRQRKLNKGEDNQIQKRTYNLKLLEKDDLLQSVLGFSSIRTLNETDCEPNAFFPLKNSDELLWEDQSEHLNSIILEELLKVENHIEYKQLFWSGFKQQNKSIKYEIQITQVVEGLREYEQQYFFNKQLQQRLNLLKQQTIRSDQYDITYNTKWFMINYSSIFLRVYDLPVANLREIIHIRNQINKPFKETEILGLLVYIMRALRDADQIYINHGNLNDENIFILSDGSYKIGEFGELRIAHCRDQLNIDNNDDELAKSEIDLSSQGSGNRQRFTCTYSYLKYFIQKCKPHHQLFWNQVMHPILMEGIRLNSENNVSQVKQLHNPERFSWNQGPEEVEISAVLMSQNFFSLGILAIQMMSLGKFEVSCQSEIKCTSNSIPKQTYLIDAEFVSSFIGFKTKNKFNELKIQCNYEQFQQFKIKSYDEIIEFTKKYQDKFKIVYMYVIDMLLPNCDWKLIMDQLKEEDFEPSKDYEVYKEFSLTSPKESTLLDHIVQQQESDEDIGLLTRAFGIQQKYGELRKNFYQIQSYMLIRNFKVSNVAINYVKNQLKLLSERKETNKLNHYKINSLSEILFTQVELFTLNLFQALSQLEVRQLKIAFSSLLDIENDLEFANADTLKYVNHINVKYYQGLATYISGEAEDAIKFFDQVMQLSRDNLIQINEQAYYQFIHTYFLLQLDQDGYFIAFKYIEELTLYHEHNCRKYNFISKDLILAYFNRGKAYYEVSQFMLSRHYFTISQNLIKIYNGSGSDMDTLRLINLGYLSYVNFLINDMDSMREYLAKSVSIMIESLSSSQCLETVVMWFNFFGFLLKSQFTDIDEMYAQIELFELSLEQVKLKTDKFFKFYVFGKMYYYAGNIKKAQELFLDALLLQQYHISDELRVKQTQNISQHQQKEAQEQRIKFLKQYQEQQLKFNSTLPPPERDNLTVRILIEIYDWLGYIFTIQKDSHKATKCYTMLNELIQNLFAFEATLVDEYTLRLAKIKFYLKEYDECLTIFYKLSCDLKKEKVDDDLIFEYQQIQSEISRWIGILQLLANKDEDAQQSFRRSRDEIHKLIKPDQDIQNQYKKLTTVATKMVSDQDQFEFQSRNQTQISQQQDSLRNYKNFELKREIVQYQKLQQSSILIIIIQNYMKIIWHCIAMNLKQKAIYYTEECMDFLQYDEYLNTSIFSDVLQPSLKSDFYLILGYLYGLRGQHEETNVYYQRAFRIVKETHDNNQLDQQITNRISVLYDQMSRVLANQGFYIKAKHYLIKSLQLLSNLKRAVDQKQLAYKNANLGALNLRLGRLKDAQSTTERACQIFEQEYGKISIPVITVKSKLLEILLKTSKTPEIKKTLLLLIRSYKILSEKDFSIRLDGQIDRMAAQFKHKQGHYEDAYNLYIQAFVKLLDDYEVGMVILSEIQKGNIDMNSILKIKSSDKASLDVALQLCQLYIDNFQFAEAYAILKELLILSQGAEYDPPKLNAIQIFGVDYDVQEHKQVEGIISTLNFLNKLDNDLSSMTVYECRRNQIIHNLKNRRNINILFQADIYRLLSKVLNYWKSLQQEPYLYKDYKRLLTNPLYQYFSKQEQIDEIEKLQQQCFFYLLDALIIYQESIGDTHENFIETLFLLAERLYLMENYEEVETCMPQIIGLIKNQNLALPIRYWKCCLIQCKTRLLSNVVGKQLIKCMQRFCLHQDDDEITYLKKTIKLLKLEDFELNQIIQIFNKSNKSQVTLKFMQIMSDTHRDLLKPEIMLPGQHRIIVEAEKLVQKTKQSIGKHEKRIVEEAIVLEGNLELIEYDKQKVKYEIQKLQIIFDSLLYNEE